MLAAASAGCGDDAQTTSTTSTATSTTTGMSSSANTGGSSAGGAGGSSSSSEASTGTAFMSAPHPAAPHVDNLGGTLLTNPKVQVIEYTSDAHGADMDAFVPAMAKSTYWPAVTAEYGVGALTVKPPIHLSDAPPTNMTDSDIVSALKANTSGASPAWGAADPNTIYLFVLPVGTTIDAGGNCCESFDGYHDEANVGSTAVPYAVVCECPGFDGPMIDDLGQLTTVVSHELVEAATDPFVQSSPAFAETDTNNFQWTFVTGGELADMCAEENDSYVTPPDLPYTVQRSWSNKGAAAGTDPCVPADPSVPYFNAAPVLPDLVSIPGVGATKAVKIGVGQTRTVELDLFSTAPIAPWTVEAIDFSSYYGGPKRLDIQVDPSKGTNGDKLTLTIKVLSKDPQFGSEPFLIYSSTATDDNVWVGLVAN